MGDSDIHDNLLFNMLEECKTLPVFFDHIFGFLNRRSDFYNIATDPRAPVGLPPGFSEQIVKHAFFKWKPKENSAFPPEVESKPKDSTPKPKTDGVSPTFTSSECYNGAKFDNYSWSQNLSEVDVSVKLPPQTAAKDLTVSILPDKISVKLKNNTVLLEGDLCDKCKHNDAIWSLQKNKLDIHLDKNREMWWNCLIQSEPKLDVSKLDCSRPYEELPEEAQAKLEELKWNQERKRLGLPTSDQLAMESILKKSWNAAGSPFSGPFDPTSVKFS